jgi:hypothetical protein
MLYSSIQNAIKIWNKPHMSVDYMDPSNTYANFVDMAPKVKSIVVLDATGFEYDVNRGENAYYISELAPTFEFSEQMIDYYNTAEVVMPDEQGGIQFIEKDGGMPSGVVGTNLLESMMNAEDIIRSSGPINRFFEGYHVRGDDIITYWDTRLEKSNIEKLASNSLRSINPDKSDVRTDSAWFAKLYLDTHLSGWTKPVFLVLNSLIFKERESDPITSTKYYTSIASTSILNSLEHHPFGSEVVQAYWKDVDKYSLHDLDDAGLETAATKYIQSHNWQAEHGIISDDPRQFVKEIRSSWAAEVSA